MLNIITGKTGSGKSTVCLEAFAKHISDSQCIFNDKTDAFYFVPEQFAVTEEKRLLSILNKPMFGYEVTNFKRFAFRLLSEYGGVDAKKHLTPADAVILLTKVIYDNSNLLTYFTELLDSPRQICMVKSLIDEFDKYDVSPEALTSPDIIRNVLSASASKFDDLALLLKSYRNMVNSSYSDDRTVYKAALEIIDKKNVFDQCDIWIDNFTGFTNIEYKFITLMLTKARNVYITLPTSLDNDIIYDPIDNTYRILIDLCKKTGIEYKVTNLSDKPYSKNVTLSEYSDMFSEVKDCAETIKKLNREGIDYNDFIICCRDISDYDTLIKSVFSKYEIPIHIDSKKNIDNNPLIKAIMSSINIILNNWRYEDVLSLAKTRFLPVDPDKMENIILMYGLKGKKDWSECTDLDCTCIFNYISDLENELQAADSIHHITFVFCEIFKKYAFDQIIKDRSDEFLKLGNLEFANEYYRTWNIVLDIFEKINVFLGGTTVSSLSAGLGMMKKLLEGGFSSSKIGFIPQMNSCVNIINIERLRTQNKKYLFFLGANEEFLPKKFDDSGILKDKERDVLTSFGITLADDTAQRSCKEHFFIDNLLKNKVENLIISYSISTLTGDEMHPCAAITSKLKKINHVFIRKSIDLKYESSDVFSPEILLEDSTVNEMFHPDNRTYNVSIIEQYMQCPYKFFIQSGMFVDDRQSAELIASDVGNVMHEAVGNSCKLLSEMDFGTIDETTCIDTVSSIFDKIVESDKYKFVLKNIRNLRLINRLKSFSGSVLWYVYKTAQDSNFRPFLYEYSYKPIEIDINYKNCNSISLKGRIDRCDVFENDSGKFVRVIDYKSSNHDISTNDVYQGYKLQLISYLYAFIKNNPEYNPAGSNYFIFDSDINHIKTENLVKGKIDENNYTMSGFILDNDEIIKAYGRSRRNKNILSEGEIANLFVSFENHVKSMLKNLLDCKITPYPNGTKDVNPCQFCTAKSICAIKKSACIEK